MPSPQSLPAYFQSPRTSKPPLEERLSPILTRLSHFSSPFITTFLLVHLSAPVMANVGGSSLSSQVMLLGREYYQGSVSEPWLLFAPLGIHITAGITKRLLSPAPISRRPSLLTYTAYPLLLFGSIHVLTHRFIPSTPSPPISALSPSELDYEFVKAGLAGWPLRSWVLYTGLVVCGLVHAFEGWNVVLRTWGGGKGTRKRSRRVLAGAGVGVVLSGLYVVSKELLLALESTLSQIHASYASSVLYHL